MIKGRLTADVKIEEDVLFSADRYRLSKRHVAAADALYKGEQLKDKIIMIHPMREYNVIYRVLKK